jgi:hypothetical protein
MARKEKTYHYIYKTTYKNSGKYYVGMHSTDNLNDGYIGSGKIIRYAIKRYGKDNFIFEIIEFLSDRKSLIKREIEIVNKELLSDTNCVNIVEGGSGGIKWQTDEQRAYITKKASEYQKEKWKDKEYREKITEVLRENTKKNHQQGKIKYNTTKGKNITEEHKQKIGEANKIKQSGSSNSQFGTRWITNGTENKKIKKTSSIPNGWEIGRRYLIHHTP